ncbi:lipolytic protein G-D-S-L family [Pseudonocardia dioxanivorans CB1190]|uniref:Lipolytic protein G-D-S-L family n=1 Tax=Pseudonocardia dioxanivorans (strain ATCC 55486 / DSM 44775 / JCM 13855 / CB1190) TaxID=675635 RepID=F4CYS8_PSEUX|nr:GDSL-type esterase/lipase family protein [Pseudonocardia dioxanivorans]AEA27653.1 lipolytic protein G-D-S-L family [Pseudonocardia dioxanivorans CB1190]
MSAVRDLRVVALGDSFVAGVGDPDCRGWFGRLVSAAGRRGIATTAYNLGVRRDTSRDVLTRWDRKVAARRAPGCDERLVVSFGVNDSIIENGAQRVVPGESAANLGRLLTDASHAGLATIVVGPPPIADASVNRRVVELNARFRDVCDSAGAPFVDVVHELAGDELWTTGVRDGDGAHPGAQGYERLAALVLPTWLDWIRVA